MKEIETKYNHSKIEEGKYENWKKAGYFNSGDKSKDPFCIVIPPPNVTGKLHLGHYFGAVQNWVQLQDDYNTYIEIADVQALTDNFNKDSFLLPTCLNILGTTSVSLI